MMTTMITKQKAAISNVQKLAAEIVAGMSSEDEVTRTLAVAQGIIQLSDAMTDEAVQVIMSLQGHELGFKTDKETGYPADVVKGIAIRAMLHGAKLTGNEFNIIAKSLYLTQAFFVRQLKEFPGLTDLVIDVDAPDSSEVKGKNQWFRIGGYACCKVNGKPVEVFCRNHPKFGDSRVIVKAYDNDTAIDGAMGKAKKRIAQKLYERISGVTLSDDEPGVGVTVLEPKAIEQPATPEPAKRTPKQWAALFEQRGVIDQAKAIRDAADPPAADAVFDVIHGQHQDKAISDDQFELLKEYYNTKWPSTFA